MTENKYRMWDDDNKEMVDGDSLAFEEYALLCDQLKDTYAQKFMQYVGAKDVNDKEIYEGDIVRMHYFAEGHDPQTLGAFETDIEVVGVVEMDVFGAMTRTADGKEYIWALLLEDVGEEIEVLGNIYENPDLKEEVDLNDDTGRSY